MAKLLFILPIFFLTHVLAYPGNVEEPDLDVAAAAIVPEEISKKEAEDLADGVKDGKLRVEEIEVLKEDLGDGKVSYEGSQLWRVVAESKDHKRVLGKLRDNRDVSMWGGNLTAFDILVKKSSKDRVKSLLEQNNMLYDIVIEDLQKAIDEENPAPSDDEDELAIRQGHRMSWDQYHRLSDIHSYLDYLAQTYPQLCSVQTIGSSVHGRAIKILKISNGQPGNKAVWVDGGMHAREWISPATTTFIINHFVLNIDSEQSNVRNIDWYFLPVANPDGYEYSHTNDRLWRKNRARSGQCAGTDLNRNFGYKWGGKGSGKNPCQEIYGGAAPFSEPETAAIRNFITSNGASWKAYISFHSYGQYVLFPWGYDRVVTTDYNDLRTVGQQIASAIRQIGGPSYTVGPSGSTLYPASGGSDDWAKGSGHFKYAYTIELRDSGRYGFVLPAAYIKISGNEGLAAMRIIANAVATS